jgi:hypothetical protein
MPGVCFPAATMAGGMAMPPGPIDVCKVPTPPVGPIPMPFPNIAQLTMAVSTTTTVMFDKKPVLVEMSEIPMSNGDEPGVAGGVISGMNMGPCTMKLGSMKVKAQGKGVMVMTGMTSHNGKNPNVPVGMIVLSACMKVMVAP